ncbi:putative pregnancy-specific beta-1-glycoprotein 7 [Xenopus laevis]|uniref:Pregnancy-specific beta-1-glycoprotein 7 n=1 Tax=Xenopus laevis TaxID=8355 RepID=A0A8J0TQH4_XENLA|nr:putative pregnancy-specific beta-1-glycoprotein 7 [Xenopus laevis]
MSGLITVVSLVLFVPSAEALKLQVAVSSELRLCGLTCERDGIYTLDREPHVGILEYACRDKSKNFNRAYESRTLLDESSGCCIIRNAQKSDTGNYLLEFHEYGKIMQRVYITTCVIMDPVSVSNISTNRSGETVSVSVSYSGEEATVLWTWNGGALPERHQLSDSNKTLTVPSTDTGTFTVLVSNPVSLTSAHYNLTLPERELRSRTEEKNRIRFVAPVAFVFVGFLFIFLLLKEKE